MPKIRPDPTKPIRRVQAGVYDEDYTYLIGDRAGNVWGIQNEITREMFRLFTNYIRTLNLPIYATDPATLSRIRTALRNARVVELNGDGYSGH